MFSKSGVSILAKGSKDWIKRKTHISKVKLGYCSQLKIIFLIMCESENLIKQIAKTNTDEEKFKEICKVLGNSFFKTFTPNEISVLDVSIKKIISTEYPNLANFKYDEDMKDAPTNLSDCVSKWKKITIENKKCTHKEKFVDYSLIEGFNIIP
jgi:hypothetical protein